MLLGTGGGGRGRNMNRNPFPVRKSQSRSVSEGLSPVTGKKHREQHNTRKGLASRRSLVWTRLAAGEHLHGFNITPMPTLKTSKYDIKNNVYLQWGWGGLAGLP